MNFTGGVVQTQTPQLIDLGFSTINTLYESSVLSTPSTIIRRPMYGFHRSVTDHVFGEATSVGISAVNSDHDYKYKNEFQIWKENKEFDGQLFLMSRPRLY